MSRFSEGDYDSESNYAYLWPARVEQVVNGKRGQKMLRELTYALLALPERRLIAGAIAKPNGEVCTVGALAKYKDVDLNRGYERFNRATLQYETFEGEGWQGDEHETATLGAELGLTWTLAWQLGYMNDVEMPDREWHVPTKWVTFDVPIERAPGQSWSTRPGPPSFATHASVPDYDRAAYRGVTPEERWQRMYDWACSKVRWNLPVAA